MARTRKLHIKGSGPKRKAEKSVEELRAETEKKTVIDSCDDPVHESWMAYHLKADIKHDHGNIELIEANAEDLISGNAPTWSLDENDVFSKFLELFPAVQSVMRKDKRLSFQLAQKTSFFPQSNIKSLFRPFPNTEDVEIGIVQDAGFKLYDAMNATNLLTFGSILDQAGKPRENAFYYKSKDSFTFPLCVFGFNPKNVQDISISKFEGDSVECVFRSTAIGNGGSGGVMKLNQLQGDFKSIAQIKDTSNNEKYRGIVGKALGDALQVASLVPKIRDVQNPFFPTGKIVNALNDKSVRTIKRVIFNTGDRLAHTRAYAFGVASVYSSPSDKNGIRTFDYIPSVDLTLTDEYFINYYKNSMNEIRKTIEKAYSDLESHLQNDVLSDKGKFNTDSSTYDGKILIKSDKVEIATQYITRLINTIQKIKSYILEYVDEQIKVGPSQSTYEKLLKESIHLVPSSTTTYHRGGRKILLTLTLLKPRNDIVVGGIPVIKSGTYTWNVYETYKKIGEGKKIDDKQMNVFYMIDKTPLPNGPTIGGGDEKEVFGITFMPPTKEIKTDKTEPLKEFLDKSYLPIASEMSWNEVVEAYETYKEYPASILDTILFESLYNEYASIAGADPVQLAGSETKSLIHTRSSLKFNAFACKFNATIAGEDTDFGKELLEYSEIFTNLSKIPVKSDGYSTPPKQTQVPAASLSTVAFSQEMVSDIDTDTGTDTEEKRYPISTKKLNFGSGFDIQNSFVKKVGGQRVDRENFNIDETKSFVRVGGYPSSRVK